MTQPSLPSRSRPHRRTVTALVLVGVVAGMTGLAFASVPLYRLFCQVTGYGGTPKIAEAGEAAIPVSEKTVIVRFDAHVNPALPWHFKPLQREVEVHVGESSLAVFEAANLADRSVTGSATFNITPNKVGQYFVKVACFCFDEQTLEAGQRVDMPVSFYVDPEILNDVNTRDVHTITLSYTFFRSESDRTDQTGQAANAAAAAVRPPRG